MDFGMVDEDGNQRGVHVDREEDMNSDPYVRVVTGFVNPAGLRFSAPGWLRIRTVNATIIPNSNDDYTEFVNLNLGQCDVVVSPTGVWTDSFLCIVNSRFTFEDSGIRPCGGMFHSIGHQDEPYRYLLGNIRGLHADCKPLGRMFYVQFSKNCDFLMIRYNHNAWFRGKRVEMKSGEVMENFEHGGCFATVEVEYFRPEYVFLARLRAVQLVLLSFDVSWDPDQDKYLVTFRGTAFEEVVKTCLMREARRICRCLDQKAYYGGIPKEVANSLVEDLTQ